MGASLTPADIAAYRIFLDQLAEAAAEVTLPLFKRPLDVVNKGRKLDIDYDPVTEADQQAEKVIRQHINATYPTHNILGEEWGAETNCAADETPWTWVLDPIDGTRAYICGIPTWGTLVALNNGTQALVGMLDQPYLKERYIGTPNGSFLNGEKITCRPCTDLTQATVSTTDPTQFFATDKDVAAFNRVAGKARLVRNGYDCYAYAMVAAGFIDVVIESGLEAYDIQALIPIIEGAGGVVSDWRGESVLQGGQVVASATPELHQQVLSLLQG
ncbi:histidinol-phosphatase [Paremcibacter congregatus]|uniref:histidinol-phosphatase n=1 Tax=Paremcibacter congregatus TaxID=2043170 RepID=UPI0030EE423A|tara:strand:+ start:5322 stop:6137 length:816 start_codon:yes stop_codon:yes gene_type:complete